MTFSEFQTTDPGFPLLDIQQNLEQLICFARFLAPNPRCQRTFGFWLCAWLLFLCVPLYGIDRDRSISQLSYKFWSEKDGAPGEIVALAQTTDGFLWIGSGAGLFRFDGVKFEEYSPPPGVKLPSHNLYSLLATPDGGLWIAFRPTGLGLLKNGSLTVFTEQSELPDSPVHCLARDNDGRLWAGTETGLALRQGNRWISIGSDWNLPREMIRYLLVDREGTLWVATTRRIAFLRRGARKFEIAGSIGTGVQKLAQAKDGRVWLAETNKDIRPAPLAGENSEPQFPSIVGGGLGDFLFDRDGALWFTDMDSGIMRIQDPEKLRNRKYGFHDPELQTFGKKDGFSGGLAYVPFEDREGNIWIGCSKGLIRFRRNDVMVNLQGRYVKLLLLAGKNGGLWVGATHEEPFLLIQGKHFLHERAGGDGDVAVSVFSAANGDVWWGGRAGIWRQRGTTFKYFPLPKPAVPDYMYDMFPSPVGKGLWIRLGDVGLVHFEHGVWSFHQWPKGVPSTGTFRHGPSATYFDRSGRVWLGYTSGQVIVLDEEKVRVYSQIDGLDVGRIKVIRGLGDRIWLGGELGLMFFSKGRFQRVNVVGDQQLGAVSGIIATAEDGLWLNAMRGIVHIPPNEVSQLIADPNHRVDYRRFDYLDGLPGAPQMNLTDSTAAETSDGRLWFATDNGLAWIDPAHLAKNTVQPPVLIESVVANGRKYNDWTSLRLPPRTTNLQIAYTATSLTMPERVQFRYKLEGQDQDWQDAGTRREAFYTNLGPGSYQFRVIACNNDGVWNETGTVLHFVVLPAFYQTITFRILCVLALMAALWLLYLLRLKQVTARIQQRLGARLDERERIARELHDTLLQSFQGLLLRFQAASNLLPVRPEDAKKKLDHAIKQTGQAIVEGRDAVQGLRSSAAISSDLADAVRTIGDELSVSVTGAKAPDFEVIVEGVPRNLHPVVRDEVYRIAAEGLRNAFHHAESNRIEVEIHYHANRLRLRIRDDGRGIDPRLLEDGEPAGHWGLQGMRERAGQMGGNFEIWSDVGSGTEVELTLPASVAYDERASRRSSDFQERNQD